VQLYFTLLSNFTLLSKEGLAVSPRRIRKPSPALRARLCRQRENGIRVAFDEKCMRGTDAVAKTIDM
jgi:hypothetical protein